MIRAATLMLMILGVALPLQMKTAPAFGTIVVQNVEKQVINLDEYFTGDNKRFKLDRNNQSSELDVPDGLLTILEPVELVRGPICFRDPSFMQDVRSATYLEQLDDKNLLIFVSVDNIISVYGLNEVDLFEHYWNATLVAPQANATLR